MRGRIPSFALAPLLAAASACSHAVPNPAPYPVLPTRVTAEQEATLYAALQLVCEDGACRRSTAEAPRPLPEYAAGAYGGAQAIYEDDQRKRRAVRWGSVGVVSAVAGLGVLFIGLGLSARSTAQTLESAGASGASQRADADRYQIIGIGTLGGAVALGAVAGVIQALWGTPDEAFETEYNRELAQALAQRRGP